jgi:hypothetical protein
LAVVAGPGKENTSSKAGISKDQIDDMLPVLSPSVTLTALDPDGPYPPIPVVRYTAVVDCHCVDGHLVPPVDRAALPSETPYPDP